MYNFWKCCVLFFVVILLILVFGVLVFVQFDDDVSSVIQFNFNLLGVCSFGLGGVFLVVVDDVIVVFINLVGLVILCECEVFVEV